MLADSVFSSSFSSPTSSLFSVSSSSNSSKSESIGCEEACMCGMLAFAHWSRIAPSAIGVCGPNIATGCKVVFEHTETKCFFLFIEKGIKLYLTILL